MGVPRDAPSGDWHPVDPRPPYVGSSPLEGDVVGALHMMRDQARRQGDAEDAWIDSRPPLELARKLLHQARRGALAYGTKRACEAAAYASIAVAERLDELIMLFTQPDPDPQDALPAPLDPFAQGDDVMAIDIKSFIEDIKADVEGILGDARGVPAEIAAVLQGTLTKLHMGLSNVEGELAPEVEKDAEQVAADAEADVKAEEPAAQQAVVSGAEQAADDVAAAVEAKPTQDTTANAAGTAQAPTGEAPSA